MVDLDFLVKNFSQDVVVEDILPVAAGVREYGMVSLGHVPVMTRLFDKTLRPRKLRKIFEHSVSPIQQNQEFIAYSKKAQDSLNSKLTSNRMFRKLRQHLEVAVRVSIYGMRGTWGVGGFRYYDDPATVFWLAPAGNFFFFHEGESEEKLEKMKILRTRALEYLEKGLFATPESIECVRQVEEVEGEMLGIPKCCRTAFIESKRKRDNFFLRYVGLEEAPGIEKESYQRLEKELDPTDLPTGKEINVPDRHSYLDAIRKGLLYQIVREKGLEARIGMALEIPHEDRFMNELQQTESYKYLIERVVKRDGNTAIVDVEEINKIATEDLPNYLFSSFATFVYPCRYDCKEAIMMFRKIYETLCEFHEVLGHWYKCSSLFHILRA